MTEKRFYYAHGVVWDTKRPNGLNGISINDLDNGLRVANWLNELQNENEQLKQILNELSDMLQFDVENGIRSYPVKLSEYLSNALKELQRKRND